MMKSLRANVVCRFLIALSTAALAQSDAQKSFGAMKALAGSWLGSVKTDPAQPGMDDKPMQVSMRVTSSGNVLVHDMKQAGMPDDGSHLGDITLFIWIMIA